MRSRKDSKWRTCLIVEELEEELCTHRQVTNELAMLKALDTQRHALDDMIAGERSRLSSLEVLLNDIESGAVEDQNDLLNELKDTIKKLRYEIDDAKRALRKLDGDVLSFQTQLESNFNQRWGMLCTEHNELSRFGAEISRYACIYTSHVSNLLSYSPMHYFRAPRELMSHDYALANSDGLSNVRRTEQSLVPTDVAEG